ncbi:hypothetical protein RI065_04650 [Mycoplasmatota bacterium zrk1]
MMNIYYYIIISLVFLSILLIMRKLNRTNFLYMLLQLSVIAILSSTSNEGRIKTEYAIVATILHISISVIFHYIEKKK